MSADYRDTVLMPRTGFPMKARLPEREPALAAHWEETGLYRRLREQAAGRPKFVLHDGPPYANGHLHLGTALNKILKDVVVRSQQMLGRDSVYVPGWDCHGLPIEWQVEQAYRKQGRDKDSVPVSEFRADCRAFAEHWIDVQRAEFKRLGVIGDWDDPYTTMSFAAEAQIVRELGPLPARRQPLPRRPAGDVVAGGEDGAGRGRDRVSRPHLRGRHRRLPGGGEPAPRPRRRLRGHLDDDALDHPRQPLHRLRRGARLSRARSDAGRGRSGRGPRRPHRLRRGARAGSLRRRRRDRPPRHRRRPPRQRLRRQRLRPPPARPGLRLSRAADPGGPCHHRAGHRLRAYRAGPRRRGFRGGRATMRAWRRTAADARRSRPRRRWTTTAASTTTCRASPAATSTR